MRSALLLAASAALAAWPATDARACSVCAAGDPLVAAGDAAPAARELRMAVEAEWLTASAAMEGMDGMLEQVDQSTVRALAVYSPLARLNAVLSVPLVRKDVSYGGAHPSHETSGVGDAELGLRWFAADRSNFASMRHHSVAISAGTSLPTGGDDATLDGLRLDPHSQLGTGAWGPYAGVLYRLEQSSWHAFASVSGRWRTENSHGYRYGASLHWSFVAQRQLGERVAVGLGIDGREAAPDDQDGAPVPHTGGLVLAAAPELHASLGGPLWLWVRAQLPFATQLRGTQDVGPTVATGLQYQLF